MATIPYIKIQNLRQIVIITYQLCSEENIERTLFQIHERLHEKNINKEVRKMNYYGRKSPPLVLFTFYIQILNMLSLLQKKTAKSNNSLKTEIMQKTFILS